MGDVQTKKPGPQETWTENRTHITASATRLDTQAPSLEGTRLKSMWMIA